MYWWQQQPRRTESSFVQSFLLGCLTGAIAGVAMGVLSAPHRGDVTRRKIARRAADTRDRVLEAMEELGGEDMDAKATGETAR